MRTLWFICGMLSFVAGLIGVVLPILPTVPFMLLAAFCFARSSERAYNWLINHPRLGPPIKDWQENGAIRMPAKIGATVCIVASPVVTYMLDVPVWAFSSQIVILLCVLIFIWSRPSA